MKKSFLLIVSFMFISKVCVSQQSFEGVILFKTETEAMNSKNKDLDNELKAKYGDTLKIFYMKTGFFAKKYLNTEPNGFSVNLFDAELGKLEILRKNNNNENYDVNENTLELTELEYKKQSQNINGLDCNCIIYNAVMKDKQPIKLEYCYSLNTPKIEPKLFEKYKGMYLCDFYERTSRPYLKFSITTSEYQITHTAINLVEKEFNASELTID